MATTGDTLHSDSSTKGDDGTSETAPPLLGKHGKTGSHDAAEKGSAISDTHGVSMAVDHEAERKLRRKFDYMVVPTVSLLYLFCFIDRANIGNAKIAGLEQDLNLQGNDYNILLSVFFVSYIVFEIPANLCCKWMGPGWFIPLTSLGFGIASLGTAFIHDLGGGIGVRFILGIFEAGMMPGIVYYLSRWYRRSELTFRLSLFIVTGPLAGAFGGLLASAILNLDHFGSLRSWRMIFGIEGIISIGLSIIAFFTMTDRPETARWLTQGEKDLAVARLRSERLGQASVLDKFDRKRLWLGFWNPVVQLTAWVFLLNNITVQGLTVFTPTIVESIFPNYSTTQLQLYTVPPYVVGALFEILVPALSWYFDRRMIFMIASAPLTMVGYIMFLASDVPKVRYVASFFTAVSAFTMAALAHAQVSANVVSDSSRSISIATNMMFGNIGGLVATWSYIGTDAPNYPIGNGLNLASASIILLLATAGLLWMLWDNRRRENRDVEGELRGLTPDEISRLEWRRPDWRWKP
ncbi:MFS general substrate transporter [Xylariaceae sp. FL0804]|nr:MFS general substrate transporter [Xylariaceae sp. FL0804]